MSAPASAVLDPANTRFIKLKDWMTRWGVSRTYLYEHQHDAGFPKIVRLGKCARVRIEEIEAYERNQAASTEPAQQQ